MNRGFTILIFIVSVGVAATIFWLGREPDEVGGPKPQTPVSPYSYNVEEILVTTSDPAVALGGTLTVPFGEGPFPAVILLSVAGPNDRDQSFSGHKGFHVLADHLASNGVAVARFDDRGVRDSTGDYFNASWKDLREDALAVVALLKSDSRIDPSKIGFAGMSQGGAIGALAAQTDSEIAFLVLMSAPGLPGEEALSLQLEKTLEVSGVTGDKAARYRKLFHEFMEIAKSDPKDVATQRRMKEFLNGPGKALIPPYQFMPEDTDDLANVLLGPWYRSNIFFDPQTTYGMLEVPVLAIGGERDFVAPPDHHLANIERTLAQAPSSDVTITVFPGLNHLLQEAETGLPTEYALLQNSFSPDVLITISEWINDRFRESAAQ